jgi:ADP-heptose:LPS heptosyltransferase
MADAQPPGSAIAALARWRHRPLAQERLGIASNPARILVLKPHDQLGDFVLATPAIRALRARYPRARLALLTREFLAPLARLVPDVDEVWVLPRIEGPGSLGRFLATLLAVASFRPDLAFVMNSVSRSKSADAFAWLSGARLVIGRRRVFAGPLPGDAPEDPAAAVLGSPPKDPLYDLDLEVGRSSRSQVDRLLDLVRWCTGPILSRVPRLELPVATREAGRSRIEEALRASPESSGRRTVGLHPGAANELKCWPLESFVALGLGLAGAAANDPPRLVVFDSPRERGRAAAVVAGLAAEGVHAGLMAAGGIGDFAATCAALDLLACNDSGVMHIAASLGVATVSFHSLGRPEEWAPLSDRSIAFHAAGGIAAIPVAPAVEAARALLAVAAPP